MNTPKQRVPNLQKIADLEAENYRLGVKLQAAWLREETQYKEIQRLSKLTYKLFDALETFTQHARKAIE